MEEKESEERDKMIKDFSEKMRKMKDENEKEKENLKKEKEEKISEFEKQTLLHYRPLNLALFKDKRSQFQTYKEKSHYF